MDSYGMLLVGEIDQLKYKERKPNPCFFLFFFVFFFNHIFLRFLSKKNNLGKTGFNLTSDFICNIPT